MNRAEAMEKIRKCFALSESSNENEAAQALKHALALMKKFNVEHGEVLSSAVTTGQWMEFIPQKPSEADQMLMNTIAHLFGLMVVQNNTFGFRYVGRESMVEIATYTTEVVRRQMMKISREFKKRNNFITNQMKKDYDTGMMFGLYKKIEAFTIRTAESDKELTAYRECNKMRTVETKKNYSNKNQTMLYAGNEAASAININTGMSQNAPQAALN